MSLSGDEHVSEESDDDALTLLASASVPARAQRAHDIKNLVGCISAIAFLLERDAAAAEAPFHDRIARLRNVSDRLCDLVKGELTDATPTRADAEAFCVIAAARAVVTRAHDRALDAGVRLHLLTEPAHLTGDRPSLEEALFNLVVNAIDATPPGGTVVISTRRTVDGDHEWAVRDTGCGIPKSRLCELGRPGNSSKVGGSGFGLSSAQHAIAEHGGVLRVQSKVGRGTTFTIFIPAL